MKSMAIRILAALLLVVLCNTSYGQTRREHWHALLGRNYNANIFFVTSDFLRPPLIDDVWKGYYPRFQFVKTELGKDHRVIYEEGWNFFVGKMTYYIEDLNRDGNDEVIVVLVGDAEYKLSVFQVSTGGGEHEVRKVFELSDIPTPRWNTMTLEPVTSDGRIGLLLRHAGALGDREADDSTLIVAGASDGNPLENVVAVMPTAKFDGKYVSEHPGWKIEFTLASTIPRVDSMYINGRLIDRGRVISRVSKPLGYRNPIAMLAFEHGGKLWRFDLLGFLDDNGSPAFSGVVCLTEGRSRIFPSKDFKERSAVESTPVVFRRKH